MFDTQVNAFLVGLIFMFSIIFGLGPQNIHVLRCGLKKERTLPVVLICVIGDILIIILGTMLVSYLTLGVPSLKEYLKYGGFLALMFYAGLSLKSAYSNGKSEDVIKLTPIKGAFLLTFLNPCVYLDSFFIIGQQANLYGNSIKWFYASGASVASASWYFGLGFGALFFGKFLNSDKTSFIFDLIAGLILIIMAFSFL
jgi:L-lysine exporter family protein LysE/ArgO